MGCSGQTATNSEKKATKMPLLMNFDWSGFAPRAADYFFADRSVTGRMRPVPSIRPIAVVINSPCSISPLV